MVARLRWLTLVGLLAACSQATPLPPLLVVDRGVEAIDSEGGRTVLLDPESGAIPSQATWAPDGTFAVWTEISADGSNGMIAMGNAASQRRIDGGTVPFFYDFSPDGKTVAYLGNDPEGAGVALGMLNVASGSGRLIDSGQPYFLDWSPDSDRLIVHANLTELYLLTPDGERTDLESGEGVFQAPAFLPTGEVLVPRDGNLITIDLDSGATRTVTSVASFAAFAPSPDGEQVALIENESPAPGLLQVVALNGGEAQTLDSDPVIFFDWSPDGENLAFLTITNVGLSPGIWDGQVVKKLDPFLPTRTFFNSYLPFWDQYSRSMTMWRADSSGFVLPRTGENETAEIVFFPRDGSASEVLTRGEMAVPAP